MRCIPFLLLLICSLPGISQDSLARRPITLEELGIEVTGATRQVAFTNKSAGVFSTETGSEHTSGWQGWRVYSKEMLEDYRIHVGGYPLLKSEAIRTIVYPHQLRRFYANGIHETVTLLDSLNALVVELDNVQTPDVAIYPLFSDASHEDEFDMGFNRNVLTLVHKSHPVRTPQEAYPAAVSVSWIRENLWAGGFYDSTTFGRNFSPAFTKTVNLTPRHVAVFTVGDSAYDAITLMKFVAKNVDSLLDVRKARMERVVNASFVRTDNPRFDKALHWAMLSLDALMMNQTGRGIFAGLPWFDNYWGRDTYISLPGATLTTGKFAEARLLLKTFAAAQDTNLLSQSYGRVPNLITTTSTSYNTADGTPWFTIALDEYFTYAQDRSLLEELYPAVRRGIEGTLKYHCDSLHFLTHGDAETWMDAVGPAGAWSPRGNRANDIQGLWYRQLTAAARIATMLGDFTNAAKWKKTATALQENFLTRFLNPGTLLPVDHLLPDGKPVNDFRPNQMFTEALLGADSLVERMFLAVTQELVYPHGVASLSQENANFHPYHHYPPYYVQDAAYHNGIVWTWLAGKWMDLAVRHGVSDLAFTVTGSMVDQILERGAVGTLAELADAAPRPGESSPRLSGAYSQAWSLAEFVRTFYQSYLGVSVTGDSGGARIIVTPSLPEMITRVNASIAVGKGRIALGISSSASATRVELTPGAEIQDLEYGINLIRGSRRYQGIKGELRALRAVTVESSQDVIKEIVDGKSRSLELKDVPKGRAAAELAALRLATPVVKEGLASLRPPPYSLLRRNDVKAHVSGRIVYDVTDPERDDVGSGSYTYPSTPVLKPGSLDIRRFTVSADERNVHFALTFRDLSNPGWHPEYGFQLTYAAIAIDKDGKANSGASEVGMNARYRFGKNFRFENIIYVGGGVALHDARGSMLAVYYPVEGDEKSPLGDDKTRTIEFALPVALLGTPTSSWRYAVLIGAQDDHGGAGLGEFRSVEGVRSEWTGGGKRNRVDSNIYDTLLPKR